MELTLLTFNLRYHNAADGPNAWPHRVEAAAQVIARNGATVVGTQEGLLDMLRDLEPHLPGYAWLGRGRDGDTAGEFNAIFYRTDEVEAVEHGQFWLSESPGAPGSRSWESACPRICTWARFRWKAGVRREFLLFNTHLDHKSQEAREKGIAMVCRALATSRKALGCPAFLMGDLNATPDNPVVQFLRGRRALGTEEAPGLQDAYGILGGSDAEVGASYHGFLGAEHGVLIDYIFGTGDVAFSAVRILREKGDGGVYPSDHYPVLAAARLS